MVEIQGRDPVDENTPGLINARALREPRSNCELFEGGSASHCTSTMCVRMFADLIDGVVIDAKNASTIWLLLLYD